MTGRANAPRHRRRPGGALAGVALALLLLGGCRQRPPVPGVFIIGVDGFDYALVARMMRDGQLPELARLADEGLFQPLRSAIPPQSPVAWSDFTVGHDAGVHGIFDFIHRDPATLVPYLSTSRAVAPEPFLRLGRWQLPRSGHIEALRQGTPFWASLTARGVPTTIVRMPGNFPPSALAEHELSGMGTPDLLGTYGTYSIYRSRVDLAAPPLEGGRRLAMTLDGDIASASLPGPPNPFLASGEAVQVRFSLERDPEAPTALLTLGAEPQLLRVGRWSAWMPVDFPLVPTQHLRGMVRFYLQAVHPDVVLYASPVNIDPAAPAMPISTPADFAATLSRATGRYYTQGIVEETKALSDGVFSRTDFLSQVSVARQEAIDQFRGLREQFTGGLFFVHFGFVDQVSHMLWRTLDPDHPAYDPARDLPFAGEIGRLYQEVDALIGETRAALPSGTTLIVMSDHGFTSWRRTFHLNTWLRERGYLALRTDAPRPDPGGLASLDFSRTKAYGLGLNGLYINRQGRERDGVVGDGEAQVLLQTLRRELLATTDPQSGAPAVTAVFGRDAFEPGDGLTTGPDLIVGYAQGVRGSNESAVGAVPDRPIFEDNSAEWSGDHCMDPAVVPGVLFSSRALPGPAIVGLKDLTAAIRQLFGD